MKKGKRFSIFNSKIGQATIFIVIAIVLIGGILIGMFLFSNKEDVKSMGFGKQATLISDSVFQCFKVVSQDSLDYVGNQGGYFSEPNGYYLDTGFYFMPFYYFDNESYAVSSQIISKELGDYFRVNAGRCLNSMPENVRYIANYKQTNVTINNNSVVFVVDLELFLSRENESVKLDFSNKPIEIDSNILEMNQLSSYIVYSYMNNKQYVCLDCISDVASNLGFNVNIDNEFQGALIVDILDNRTDFYPQDYKFLMTKFPINSSVPITPHIIGTKNSNPNLNLTAPMP